VLQAAVLSIVLTLATGPSAALLCKTWCIPQAVQANGCHHLAPTASTSVSAHDTCDDLGPGLAPYVREDMRRGVSVPDVAHAIVVPSYQFRPSTINARPCHQPGREWSLEQRPLSTILRI
jgi:hypothetical protein